MCGIAGLIDLRRPPKEDVLRAMDRCLTHRGPDEGGRWTSTQVALVHRRLRIIDLSALAAQPMGNEDGRVQVIYNGEIYNHHALRQELTQLGHTFRSRSDTEVLVHGYEAWGPGLVRRLRGMFAFAIWDENNRRLLLARDRLGKKPLFYREETGRLIFGSELDVFKVASESPLRLSLPAFRQYLEYGYVASPDTLLQGVQRLPAGHYAVWREGALKLEAYWSLPTTPPGGASPRSVDEAARRLEPLLRDAVSSRLESDVPLGCFLSGGIDSSLVAALAAESLGRPLKTYTVGFEGSPMSEARYARKIAEHLGTEHHELPIKPTTMVTEFEELLSHAAEPLGDDSYLPTFLISRETRRFVTVALSGDGGDELFAGYAKYAQYLSARPWLGLPLPWELLARLAPNDALHKRASALATGSRLELARWLSTLWKRAALPDVLAPQVGRAEPDLFERAWRQRAAYPELERWLLTDMATYLEGNILVKVDRANMAVSLEGRSPFLDGPLVEEVLQWPERATLPQGGKAILKRILAKRLPVELFERPKQGFGMPVEQWFRGELKEVLLRYTAPDRIAARGLLSAAPLQHVVQAHLSGRRNYSRRLYAVLAFELWADRFFGPGVALA
jgi:asparagine synthase (glutamine-hydrolysing)